MEIEKAFRAYGRGNMSLQAVKLPISHNNVVGENSWFRIHLQLNFFSLEMNSDPLMWEHQSPKYFCGEPTILHRNILETGVLTRVAQNSSPTRRSRDEVELEMNSEPRVWEHPSPKCWVGELCSLPPHHWQPRWLRRSRVHSLMIARRSLCPEKLRSNPGQGSKGINFWGLAWSRYVHYCDKETLSSNKPTNPPHYCVIPYR